jgi:hypothetical protein
LSPERRLIVDATFPWRIAEELERRGYRDATSPHQLGNPKIKDPPLLKMIHDDLEPAVLVTFDNKMPVEHAALLIGYGTTLAVVDKDAEPPDLTRDEYWREVIHRHAHRMANQEPGSAWIYRRAGRRKIELVVG